MELKAVVMYKGEPAHYSITSENRGIFHARLLKYEGKNAEVPPENILMVKSVRHWTGSYNEPYVIEELGRAIEERNRRGDPAS